MAWFQSLCSLLRRPTSRARSFSHFSHLLRRRSYRPTVEGLEDRQLLAAWKAVGPAPEFIPSSFDTGGSVSPGQNVSGLVSALAFSPDSDGRGTPALYLGTAGGGVWVSNNFQGNNPTWKPLTDFAGLPGPPPVNPADGRGTGAINVGAVAVDPNHPRTIYVGTGFFRENYGTGILRSTDGGANWTLLPSNGPGWDFYRHAVTKIIVDPTDLSGNTLYAAVRPDKDNLGQLTNPPTVNDGVFRSTNGGQTWTRLAVLPGGANAFVTDLEYTVADNRLTLFAGIKATGGGAGGVFRSVAGGAWTPAVLGLPAGTVIDKVRLAADHTRGRAVVYAAVSTTTKLVDVYGTVDNGATWEGNHNPFSLLNPTIDQGGDALALSPVGRLYLGSSSYVPANPGVFESNVGAKDFLSIAQGSNGMIPHTDGQVFAFGPDGNVYYGNDGGLWRYRPQTENLTYRRLIDAYAVGTDPRAIVSGDFTGDFLPDLAVLNRGTNPATSSVTILRGKADGSFIPLAPATAVGNQPVALATGYFNNDEHLDLAVADSAGGNVTILLGNGNGTFRAAPAVIHVSANLNAIVAADFNNDGNLDVAVTDPAAGVFIVPGAGNGAFAPAPPAGFAPVAVGTTPVALAVANFRNVFGNNRPILDLLVVNSGSNDVSFLQGRGNGTFDAALSLHVGSTPTSVAVSNFDTDGTPDLLVGLSGSSKARVIYVTRQAAGNLLFTPQDYDVHLEGATAVAAADVNGDGRTDIVVAHDKAADQVATVLTATGNRTFGSPLPHWNLVTKPLALVVRDFNRDGMADFAYVDGAKTKVRLSQAQNRPTLGPYTNLNSSGLQTHLVNSVALSPSEEGRLLEGSHDNGFALRINANVWTTVGGGDGGMVRFKPTNGTIAFRVGQVGDFERSNNANAATPSFGGGTMPGGAGEKFPFYSVFAIDPNPTGALQWDKRLVMGSTTRVWWTNDNGDTWTAASAATGQPGALTFGGAITALAYDPRNGNNLYVGGQNGRIYRTSDLYTNPLATWSADVNLDGEVKSIAVDPANWNIAYAVVSLFGQDTVFCRDPTTGAWDPINTNALPKVPANAIALDKTPDGQGTVLYVGTDIGVYRGSSPNGVDWTWERFGNNLPNVRVTDLQLQAYAGQQTKTLAAATFGRGVWTLDVLEPRNRAAIGDRVWLDSIAANSDEAGIQNAGENGIANVEVKLLSAAGGVLQTTQTNATGNYLFDNLDPGTYRVQFTLPAGYQFVAPDQGTNDALDSDVTDLLYSRTQPFTVGLESKLTVDAGLVQLAPGRANLGNRVWADVNRDGVQGPEAEEPGVAGVTVRLLDGNDQVVQTTTTGSTGIYQFTGVLPGTYTVEFVPPEGYSITAADQDADDIDSDPDPSSGRTGAITLAADDNNQTVDAGLIAYLAPPPPGVSVADAYVVEGNSGTTLLTFVVVLNRPAPGTVTVQYATNGTTALPGSDYQAAAGTLTFAPGETSKAVTVVVYGDTAIEPDDTLQLLLTSVAGADVYDDTGDGLILDDDAPPSLSILGVGQVEGNSGTTLFTFTVSLSRPSAVPVTVSYATADGTATAANGDYTPVSGTLTFGVGQTEQTLTVAVAGDTTVESDEEFFVRLSSPTNAVLLDNEASGDIQDDDSPASVGDFVWDDLDDDGVQDAGESGAAGVTVNLLDDLGNWLDSTTTDLSGFYRFENLAPGNYRVEFIAPSDGQFSPQDQTADAADSDADPLTGLTALFSLAAGENRTDVDAGLIFSGGSGGADASVGDYVWNDLDGDGIQEAGEPAAVGVPVYLLDALGNVLDSTTTDSLGFYRFEYLAAGSYRVQFVAPPDAQFSPQDQTSDNADSDADTVSGLTDIFNLVSGEDKTDLDAGLIFSGGPGGSGG